MGVKSKLLNYGCSGHTFNLSGLVVLTNLYRAVAVFQFSPLVGTILIEKIMDLYSSKFDFGGQTIQISPLKIGVIL